MDLFVNACTLYAEKYSEECIDIIDVLENADDKWQVFSRYMDSFQWRDIRYIPADNFMDMLKKYPCSGVVFGACCKRTDGKGFLDISGA